MKLGAAAAAALQLLVLGASAPGAAARAGSGTALRLTPEDPVALGAVLARGAPRIGEWRLGPPVAATVWATGGSAGLALALVLAGRWLSSPQSEGRWPKRLEVVADTPKVARLTVLDNARCLALVAIVFDHLCLMPYFTPMPDSSSWLRGEDDFLVEALFRPLLFRTMLPGFALLSGCLSRGRASPRKWRNLFVNVAAPCVIFTLMFEPLGLLLAGKTPEPYTSNLWRVVNADPNLQWYLQSLLTWRAVAFLAQEAADRFSLPLWLSFAALTLPPYIFVMYQPVPFLSLSRTAFFLPAFAVGLLFPVREMVDHVPATWPVRVSGLAVFVAWILLLGDWPWQSGRSAFVSDLKVFPYAGSQTGLEGVTGSVPDVALFWCRSLFFVLLNSVGFLAFLALLCPRSEYWWTSAGGEGALCVYLLHSDLALYSGYRRLVLWAPLPVVDSSLGHLAVRLLQLAFCFLATVALGSRWACRVFQPLLVPDWAVELLLGPADGPKRANAPEAAAE